MSGEKSGFALLWSKSSLQERFRISVNVHLDNISSTAEPFVTKFGMVMMMHHHGPECHAKRLVCCFQGQGHSKGSYDQNMTVSTVSSELLILLLPNLV